MKRLDSNVSILQPCLSMKDVIKGINKYRLNIDKKNDTEYHVINKDY